jgi:hypothetical protein
MKNIKRNISTCEAIVALNINAKVSIPEDDINQIFWHEGTTPIAISIIQAKKDELQDIENQRFEDAENAKASALAKLSALGLTQEEILSILK